MASDQDSVCLFRRTPRVSAFTSTVVSPNSTALDAMSKLRFLVRNRFAQTRQAFDKFSNHSRQVTVASIRAVLASEFNIVLSEVEFAKLTQALSPKGTPIDFEGFVKLFDVSDDIEGHAWLKTTHRYAYSVY